MIEIRNMSAEMTLQNEWDNKHERAGIGKFFRVRRSTHGFHQNEYSVKGVDNAYSATREGRR